jgi:adenylate cyclase
MRLRERLSGFISWPMSHKLFLLASVGVLASAFAGGSNALLFSSAYPSAMDLGLLNRFILAWLAVQTALALMVWPVARGGREGRWAAYVFVVAQSPFIVGLLHLYGTMGTPLVAIYPAIVILWSLVLDERIGLFGLCNLVLWMAAVGVAEFAGWLPYAPMLLERTIDAQNNPVWFGAVFMHILVLLGFVLSLCILFQRTQRSQQLRMQQAHEALASASRLIRRYVPAGLAEQIVTGAYMESARPERRRLTIVSVGIEGFIHAAEELEAEDLAGVLSHYLSEMVAIADRHEGTVSHIMGDAMLVLFGAPQVSDDHDHAMRALRMAQQMQICADIRRHMWSQHGLERPFRIRIGINTGYVSVGDFGSIERKLYSGIGLQAHIAERIQERCMPGQVLCTQATWALAKDDFDYSQPCDISVAGLASPLRVCTLRGLNEDSMATMEPLVVADPVPADGPSQRSAGELIWIFGKARFDEASHVLTYAGEPVELERKPLEVLRFLLRHAGDVVTKDELFAAIWPGRLPSETVIAKAISKLREALHDDQQTIIKTVHGYGYRFVAEIRPAQSRAQVPGR